MSRLEAAMSASAGSSPGHADHASEWLGVSSTPRPHLMIVEDDATIRALLIEIVKTEGFEVTAVPCAGDALEALKQNPASILLTDFRLPDMDGLSLLEQVMQADARTIGVVMTGFGTIDLAVKAMRLGALDILVKPFEPDQVTLLLKRIVEIQRLRHENGLLKQAVLRGAGVRFQSFQMEDMEAGSYRAGEAHRGGRAAVDMAEYQRGLIDGERKARESTAVLHDRIQAVLTAAVKQFEQAGRETVKDAEEQIPDLALAIASKIVKVCVDEKRDLVLSHVREALARVRESREVLIRIHPDDLPCVEAIRDTLLPLFEGSVVLKLEGDAGVGRGGCRVETPTRFIDATIDAQMARLEAALKREP